MKKIILFSLVSIIYSTIVTTKIFPMQTSITSSLPSILISKTSSQKLLNMKDDYQELHRAIQRKSGKIHCLHNVHQSRYNKPSDLIDDLWQDKSISTKHMTPNRVFVQEEARLLDQQFREISKQYSTVYAWSLALIAMRTTLKITYNNLHKRELIRSAARVALKQDPAFTQKCNLFDLFAECNNTVVCNLEHLEPEDKDNMLEAIKRFKNILAKNKLDTRL